jgi:hypothetical protein
MNKTIPTVRRTVGSKWSKIKINEIKEQLLLVELLDWNDLK